MRVLLLDNWTDEAKAALADLCDLDFPGFVVDCDTVDGLVVRLNERHKWCGPDNFPNLKFVASCTTGLDHIDLDYCKSRGIAVLSLQGDTEFLRGVHATAEHTMALILSLIRRVPFAHKDVCEGRWDREAWRGSELHGKHVGIVGYGRVGQQVAQLAQAFAMRLVYWDINPAHPDSHVAKNSLDEVLREADVLSVHVPLDDSTCGMFSEAQFRMMKPTAHFINTSRGAVVDEVALLKALREGWIAGAALDVMCGEPYVNEDLREYARTHDNLILTPHIAGNTAESRLKTQLRMVKKIREFIGGGKDAGS